MEDIGQCMSMGAKEYFIKPIRPDMASSLLKHARDRWVGRSQTKKSFDPFSLLSSPLTSWRGGDIDMMAS